MSLFMRPPHSLNSKLSERPYRSRGSYIARVLYYLEAQAVFVADARLFKFVRPWFCPRGRVMKPLVSVVMVVVLGGRVELRAAASVHEALGNRLFPRRCPG